MDMLSDVNAVRSTAAEQAGRLEVDDEISVIDLLVVLAKYKLLIFVLPLVLAIFAAIYSLSVPNVYKASATILPPQPSQSGAGALLAQFGGAAAGIAGVKSPNDLYVGLLKSRRVADRLVQRFDLHAAESLEKARHSLLANTLITTAKSGLITVEVMDKDPVRAAALANAYVEELLALTSTLAVTEASQRRVFFERELESAKNNLATAETDLKVALDTRGVIHVDSESRAMVESMARLRAQIASKEIQLNAMQAFVTTQNQDYKRTDQELRSMRAELSRLENGRSGASGGTDGERVGLDSIKMLRDVKYFEMLYEMLAKQYELARLDEAKEASVVQVLDKAVAPEQKAKPHRSMIVLSVAFLGLALAVVCAFLMEANERASRRPEYAEQMMRLKGYLGFKRAQEALPRVG